MLFFPSQFILLPLAGTHQKAILTKVITCVHCTPCSVPIYAYRYMYKLIYVHIPVVNEDEDVDRMSPSKACAMYLVLQC